MGPADRVCTDMMTYWAPLGHDGFGQPTFDLPCIIYGRMLLDSKVVRNQQGDVINSNTQVWVSQEVAEEGWIAEGDFTGITSPTTLDKGQTRFGQIKAYGEQADLRNLSKLRTAYLT